MGIFKHIKCTEYEMGNIIVFRAVLSFFFLYFILYFVKMVYLNKNTVPQLQDFFWGCTRRIKNGICHDVQISWLQEKINHVIKGQKSFIKWAYRWRGVAACTQTIGNENIFSAQHAIYLLRSLNFEISFIMTEIVLFQINMIMK